jgi:hypothetical protein
MRTIYGLVLLAFLSASCGATRTPDGGDDQLEPTWSSDAGADVFLGTWHASGRVRRTDDAQSPTWPASFAFRIGHAANCSDYRFVDGDCTLGLAVVSGTTEPTLREIAGTSCRPGEPADFWFDGKKMPLAGAIIFSPADTTLTYTTDGGVPALTISSGGTLSAEFATPVGFAGSATR